MLYGVSRIFLYRRGLHGPVFGVQVVLWGPMQAGQNGRHAACADSSAHEAYVDY